MSETSSPAGAVRRGHDAELRHPAGGARRGQGCRVWDADGAVPGPDRRDRGQLARARPPGRGGGGLGQVAEAGPHVQPVPARAPGRARRAAAGLLGADGRVFFANSGTEANEAALKLVRRCQGPERPVIVAAEHGFHGRTMGALALTGKQSIREPFWPVRSDRSVRPFGDAAALDAAVGPDCAAVFLEPTLGEGGVVPAARGYLRRPARPATGPVRCWSLDEIQSGIGRTGTWFAHQAEGRQAGRADAGQGTGRRAADRRLRRLRPVRRAAVARAITAPRSAATRSPAPRRWRCWPRSRSDGLLAQRHAVGEQLPAGLEAVPGTRWSRGVRGRGLWLAIALRPSRCRRPGGRRAASRVPGQRGPAGRDPARAAADPQPGRGGQFLAALPAILDAAWPARRRDAGMEMPHAALPA